MENNGFKYQLPFTVNIENTKKVLGKKIPNENSDKIKLEKISINQNGLIEGHDYENYDEAQWNYAEYFQRPVYNLIKDWVNPLGLTIFDELD